MSENQKKILQMLVDGKISVAEAQRLISLIGTDKDNLGELNSTSSKSSSRFFHIVVEPKPGSTQRRHSRVNVRVPFAMIRAGMKLATLIPPEAADKVNGAMKEKGMSFDVRNLKTEELEDIITALQSSEINVDTDEETVRVYAE